MTLPNKLSLLRLAVIPLVVAALLMGGPEPENATLAAWLRLAALVLFLGATLTDWLDGRIARARNQITILGKLLDPLADKVLVASVLIALVELGTIQAWMVIIILAREFIVTGLRSLAALEGRAMAADNWGKYKTALQLVTILVALAFLAAREFLRASGNWNAETHGSVMEGVIFWMMLATTLLTVISGWVYLSKNRSLLHE
jgi:CDP-diacylglycerol--glycerol-3-phosphate 3-phosphatidyltransferase